MDTPDESKCDLLPVYVEYDHKTRKVECVVILGDHLVLNAELPCFKKRSFYALWDNLIPKVRNNSIPTTDTLRTIPT